MGRRPRQDGMAVQLTTEQKDQLTQLMNSGESEELIAAQIGIPFEDLEAICEQYGVPKRRQPKRAVRSEAANIDDDQLIFQFVQTQEEFRGSQKEFRKLLKKFAAEKGMEVSFSSAWRKSFLQKFKNDLNPNVRKLMKKSKKASGRNKDEEELLVEEIQEPIDPEEQARLEALRTQIKDALDIAMQAFAAAGIKESKAEALLANMSVPGFKPTIRTKPPKPAKVVPEPVAHEVVEESKPPAKKTPLQLRVLEREFAKNPHINIQQAAVLGDKLALTTDQVYSWFRNKRHNKRNAMERKAARVHGTLTSS